MRHGRRLVIPVRKAPRIFPSAKTVPAFHLADLCLQWFRDIDILEEEAKKENAADKK
tara:strand:+ start:873 stop:1043 length:171 start_codon:yes stop_codon:yes gene_type:complete